MLTLNEIREKIGKLEPLDQSLNSLQGVPTVGKNGTQKFPSVTVLSERPASTGRVVKGQSGTGVIMPDEPNVVYVTSPASNPVQWYGHWPIEETDIGEVLRRGQNRAAIEEIAGTDQERNYVTYDGRIVRRTFVYDDPGLDYLSSGNPIPTYRPSAVDSIFRDPNNEITVDEIVHNIIPGIKNLRERYQGLTLKEAKDVMDRTRAYHQAYGKLPSSDV